MDNVDVHKITHGWIVQVFAVVNMKWESVVNVFFQNIMKEKKESGLHKNGTVI